MKLIKNMNTLKAMQRAGFIKFCDQTGETIETLYSRKKHICHYVDDGDREFTYKGKRYGIKYMDGCFYPFVVEYEKNESTDKKAVFMGL